MFTFTDDIDRFGLPYKRYDYQINGNEEIVGILFGHFAPFTGPNGHGRMLTALQNIGAKKFLIATPDTRDKIDEDRCMFNTEQRMKIAKMALQVMGLEGTATSIIGGRNPDKIFSKLARVACDNFGPNIRPVFCFGPDREDLANSSLTSFGNKSNSTNFECLVLRDRGEEATSGTAVRNCIKSGDIDGIVRMTGYTTEVAQSLITMWQKNDAVLKAPKEDGMSGKHGLPHLFNDGKSTQMSPSQFLDFIDYLDTTGKGILSKANFQVTEKIDGSSSFLGVDEEGLFFTKFGFSSKARVEDDLPTIYRNLFKFLKECGMQELLEKWRKQEGVDEIKVQLENVWPEASKTPIDQFVKIVLIPYLPEKIGKGLIIPIQVVSDGKASPNSAKIISEVKSVLAENGITSPDLEYDYEDLDLSEDIAAIKQDIAEIEKRLGNDIRTITANSRTKDSREVKALIAEYQKELQQKIASQFPAGKFGDYYEGLVIKATNGLMFKITSDKFKQYMDIFNKRGAYKESMNTRITERIEGDKILAWSSSKDPNLFEFYYDNVLRFGGTAGSCYGFAVYLVTEPPKSEEAAVGYSSAVRDNLYGTNVFEFEIDQSKVLIFNYDDFLLTKLGQATQASFEDYIKVQCQNIGLTFTEAEYAMIQPDSPDTTNAKCARNFYKLMSRKYYQGRRGNLRTPCDGLEYWGQNDGKTLVIWNNHRLVPRQYSNDNGATWKPIDKTDPRYIDYLRRSNLNDVNAHHQDHINSIFDNHWTEEKEKIYRYLTAFSSNDIEDREGMAAGIFYNIVIHDDRSIDAAFKSNLPMVDSYNHYFRLSKGNPMLDNIYRMGYYFGTLDCGLKIGSEKQSEDTYQLADDIPEHVFPVAVTGGLKLVNAHINRDALSKIPTTIKGNTLAMDLCQIEEDIFDKYEVHISSSKPCYCEVPGLLEDLQAKYDWAIDRVKPGHPLTPEEKLAKKNAEKAAKLKDKIALAKTDKAREKAQQVYNDFLAETGLKESIIESTLDRATFMSFIERLDEADGMLNDVDLSEPAINLLYELDNHDWMTESEHCNYPVDCLEEALLMPNHCWNKSNLKKVCENSLREMQNIYEAKAKENIKIKVDEEYEDRINAIPFLDFNGKSIDTLMNGLLDHYNNKTEGVSIKPRNYGCFNSKIGAKVLVFNTSDESGTETKIENLEDLDLVPVENTIELFPDFNKDARGSGEPTKYFLGVQVLGDKAFTKAYNIDNVKGDLSKFRKVFVAFRLHNDNGLTNATYLTAIHEVTQGVAIANGYKNGDVERLLNDIVKTRSANVISLSGDLIPVNSELYDAKGKPNANDVIRGYAIRALKNSTAFFEYDKFVTGINTVGKNKVKVYHPDTKHPKNSPLSYLIDDVKKQFSIAGDRDVWNPVDILVTSLTRKDLENIINTETCKSLSDINNTIKALITLSGETNLQNLGDTSPFNKSIVTNINSPFVFFPLSLKLPQAKGDHKSVVEPINLENTESDYVCYTHTPPRLAGNGIKFYASISGHNYEFTIRPFDKNAKASIDAKYYTGNVESSEYDENIGNNCDIEVKQMITKANNETVAGPALGKALQALKNLLPIDVSFDEQALMTALKNKSIKFDYRKYPQSLASELYKLWLNYHNVEDNVDLSNSLSLAKLLSYFIVYNNWTTGEALIYLMCAAKKENSGVLNNFAPLYKIS